MGARAARPRRCGRARRRRAPSSPTTSTSPSRSPQLPSHRVLAMLRGEKEDVLDLGPGARGAVGAAGPSGVRAPHRPRASASPTAAAPATSGCATRCAGPGGPGSWCTSASTCGCGCGTAAEDEAVKVFAANLRDLLLAAPAGTRADAGARPGLPHRREGRGGRRDRQGRRHRRDLPARPARTGGTRRSPSWPGWRKEHAVDLVAIGNGTASRETDKLAGELIAGTRS